MAPYAVIAALLVGIATAAPNNQVAKTSTASKQICITKYRVAPGVDVDVPTKTRTTVQTVTSTVTTCGGISTTTVTFTPYPYTSTVYVNDTSTLLTANDSATTATQNQRACQITTTISSGVATTYTGTYNVSIPEQTRSPFELMRASRHRNTSPKLFHVFGQSPLAFKQRKMAVDCLAEVTTYYVTTSTRFEEPETETKTASTPTVYVTQAIRVPVVPTAPRSLTTSMIPGESSLSGLCTVTSAQSTTVQHIKCAPTNLISSINGKGIGLTGGDSANTRGLAPGSDPSACCQLCVDDEACAASEDDPDAGNCFLWYTAPSCGLGFRYSDGGQNLEPGTGFLVQTGCGTIQAVDEF